jgi:hypothetical protein
MTGTTYDVIRFPGSNTPCPTANSPGNWWATDCPGDGNNGLLDENTLNGCSTEVSIVPNQPPTLAAPSTNTDLANHLKTQCSSATLNYCLGANPGRINGAPVLNAWTTLVGTDITLPVFCGETTCNPAAVKDAGGNNTIYPVYKFVEVKVCGWSFGPKNSGRYTDRFPSATAADPCFGADAAAADGDALLLVFKQVQVTGSTSTSTCATGSACDGGQRVTLLTR